MSAEHPDTPRRKSIKLRPDLAKRVDAAAEATHATANRLVNDLVERHLADLLQKMAGEVMTAFDRAYAHSLAGLKDERRAAELIAEGAEVVDQTVTPGGMSTQGDPAAANLLSACETPPGASSSKPFMHGPDAPGEAKSFIGKRTKRLVPRDLPDVEDLNAADGSDGAEGR